VKTVTITIGEALSTAAPHDMYALKIKYMHGDADAYTEETFKFPSNRVEVLKKALILIEAASSYDFDVTNGRKWLRNFLVEQTGLSVEDVDAFFDDFVQGDVTSDHKYVAAFDGWTLTYYDSNGVGYHAVVAIA
jgi:hypothetical protein